MGRNRGIQGGCVGGEGQGRGCSIGLQRLVAGVVYVVHEKVVHGAQAVELVFPDGLEGGDVCYKVVLVRTAYTGTCQLYFITYIS